MANFGPITAEIRSGVCGTPANFNGFRVLNSLLQRRRSSEAKQTLHDVWPSPGLVHNTFLGALAPTEFCPVQNSLYVQVLHSPILAAFTARHSSSRRQPNFAASYSCYCSCSFVSYCYSYCDFLRAFYSRQCVQVQVRVPYLFYF